jgi:hypothetical protein
MPSAACPPILDAIGELLSQTQSRGSSCLMKLSTRACLRSFVTSKCISCCGIDLDQMSARYLSVYFHGESERVFMCRSKPFVRSPRRQRHRPRVGRSFFSKSSRGATAAAARSMTMSRLRFGRGRLQFQQRSGETIAGAPASPTPRASLGRVCQVFSRISITLFASSSESTAT